MKWDFIKSLSHLVVIGNTSLELLTHVQPLTPANTTLFAADVEQYKLLQQYSANLSINNNLAIKQALITTASQTVDWYQYNLPHLNALAPGNKALAALFPGLKLQQKTEQDATDITTELQALKLSGQQNILLLSSPAQNLSLLQRLTETKQLSQFSALVVQHSSDVFYDGAATLSELTSYLTEQGFELLHCDQADPEFPVLQFYRDNIAQELKQARQQLLAEQQQFEQQKAELVRQVEQARQQLLAEQQQFEQQNAELVRQVEQARQQLLAEQQQFEQQKTELAKQYDTIKVQAEKLQKELEQLQKHDANRLEKIAELEKANRLLTETNIQQNKRQQALEQEMLKAEAQIDIIKELLLKPE